MSLRTCARLAAILILTTLASLSACRKTPSEDPVPPPSGASDGPGEFANNTSTPQPPPIRMGTSGGNSTDVSRDGNTTFCCSGTLGCLVRRDGRFFILSNNHVLGKAGHGSPGDPISHPGLIDNNCSPGTRVATLVQSAPIDTSNVDAALAEIVAGAVDTSGAILDLGPASSRSIAPAPPSATLAEPAAVLSAGSRVAKSGRSTGLTCGVLQSINTDVSVDYSDTCNGPASFTVVFRNQLIIDGGTFSEAGDSGSLVVTSATARPLGLLYGGNGTSTAAHPIRDVLAALRNPATGQTPVLVGGADHSVSCVPMTSAGKARLPSEEPPAPSASELLRVSGVKERHGAELLADPAVSGVGIGTSRDNPAEGALLVYLRGAPRNPLPHHLDGVRLKVVGTVGETVGAEPLVQATAIKEAHAAALLGSAGVIGVGVGASLDSAGEPALMIYVEPGFRGISGELGGVRTRIIEGERFRTFGWGKTARRTCCGD